MATRRRSTSVTRRVGCALGCAVLISAGSPAEEPANPLTPFDADYIARKDGKTEVSVPEAFELANILLSLTDWGMEDRAGNLFTDTDYHAEMIRHFSPYRDHPVFLALEQIDFDSSFNDFVGFRENSFAYSFDGDNLVKSPIFDSWWNPRWLPNHFAENLELIQAFAVRSRFREFWAAHAPYYDEQRALFDAYVDIKRIRLWLEEQFPGRFNTVQILFSPLIRGNHTASIKEGRSFRQLSVVVAGPEMARVESVAGGDILILRQLFTEIDHGYVDPVSVAHMDRITRAFGKPGLWYGDPDGFYAKPFASFNEYMTWSAMLLYIKDHYPDVRYQLAKGETVRYMERQRKFVAFGKFFAQLEAVREAAREKTLAELYTTILDWAAAYQENAARRLWLPKARSTLSPEHLPAGPH